MNLGPKTGVGTGNNGPKFKNTGVRRGFQTKTDTPLPPEKKLTGKEYLRRAYAIRRAYVDAGDIFGPAEYIVKHCLKKPHSGEIKLTSREAEFLVWKYIKRMLDVEEYMAAAIVCWGPELFTPEPHCTRLVWKALENESKNLIMGGGSLSKSYSGAVYFGLDFLRDPEWTCIKVMSVTRSHAVQNIFAHLKNLLQSTIVPVPGLVVKADSVRVNADDKQGIHLVGIPQGDDGKGRLRGFHPVPRPLAHPVFGRLSRVVLLLDEAEEMPEGVWEDVNNVLLTEEVDLSHVKVMAATNPKDRHSRFGRKAEPAKGWSSVDIDTSESWKSAEGWHVTRLDGARCENVVQEKTVYPGLQTIEGFNNLVRLGTDNPEYYTMARGWFPEESSHAVIVTGSMFQSCHGTLVFSGPTVSAGGLDLAFEGGDFAVFTHLRHGEAVGWRDAGSRYRPFREGQRAVQVEQQIRLEKLPTLEQTKAVIRICKDLGITPPWLSVDRTGNGTGVHDALCSMFGPEVFGVMFSWAATGTKILEDDSETCAERYQDIITEMAFAARRFMETSILMLNPAMSWTDLERETVTRRYSQVGRGFLRLESKKDFKKRNGGQSPDLFDSLIVGLHGVRMNSGVSAQLVGVTEQKKTLRRPQGHGVVDTLEFMEIA